MAKDSHQASRIQRFPDLGLTLCSPAVIEPEAAPPKAVVSSVYKAPTLMIQKGPTYMYRKNIHVDTPCISFHSVHACHIRSLDLSSSNQTLQFKLWRLATPIGQLGLPYNFQPATREGPFSVLRVGWVLNQRGCFLYMFAKPLSHSTRLFRG